MTSPEKDTATTTHDDSRATQPRVFAPLRLQVALEPRADARYRVDQLLAFHDRAFVESAYAATLGRVPTHDELSATLADLRDARRDKREIVEDLIESEEGARVGARARVEGVEGAGWKRRARSLPVIGYLWQLLAGIARLPLAQRHQREFDAYVLAQQQIIVDHLNEKGPFAEALAAISLLSDALAGLAARQAEARDHFARRMDAQQEFLTQEQHAIVEAQKVALAEIEGRFADALSAQADALAKLSTRIAQMPVRDEEEQRASPAGTRARDGGDMETR
ncbi:MAG: hypothetical protein QOE33_1099 [Acidobacteriota bacterium]|nr:hypothetical protein [Acidobacteriota bacterium]